MEKPVITLWAMTEDGKQYFLAVIDYRDEHGPFKSATDLTAVKGIGDKLLEDNADKIIVEE